MSHYDSDQELLKLIGQLPRLAKRELWQLIDWMLSADRLYGGRYDGAPITGRPELVEQADYDSENIEVYKRSENGDLTYVGYRPCCYDPGCGCRFGKVNCKHNTGETFDRFTPADRDPERAGKDPASRAECAEMFREHDEFFGGAS